MPVISVNRDELFETLGKRYTQEEFDELCFEFGIELDDVVEEEGKEVYKIDLPANRYDLLCIEGLSRALLVFQSKMAAPTFKTIKPKSPLVMTVAKETDQIRPFVVCAVLRGVKFTQERYDSFIALQDQLHRNICRKRTLVAIGTHDLDTIKAPFRYEALPPNQIKFQHLFAEKEMEAKEMLDWFRNDPAGKHIKEYTGIIYDSPVYPVIFDSERAVLSLPPIINGSKSKLTLETKNVFIECTATDFTKANIVLNTVCAMFSQYCEDPFTIEQVEVKYETKTPSHHVTNYSAHSHDLYPNMSVRKAEAKLQEATEIIGASLKPEQVVSLCERMQLGPAKIKGSSGQEIVEVTVPVTRSDILHACDIIEDIAIAYGYNNIKHTVPVSHTPGGELKVNFLSDAVRNDLARFGYTELMSFALCSHDENFAYLNRKDDGKEAVKLANPKTIEFQVVRSTLLPGTLKTLAENKSLPFSDGIKLFEVTDVVKVYHGQEGFFPEQIDVGCKNERHVVCLYAGMTAGVEIIHGTVDRIMQSLAVIPSLEYCTEAYENVFAQNLLRNEAHWGEYKIQLKEKDDTFFPGMCAEVFVKQRGQGDFFSIGAFGALHPTVLENYKLSIPCSVLELNLEPFV